MYSLLHVGLGFVNVEIVSHLVEIVQNGVILSVFPVLKRLIAFRYLINGVLLVLMGFLMNCYINDSKRNLPSSVGWGVTVLGLFVCLASPYNFVHWGVALIGIYVVYLSKKN